MMDPRDGGSDIHGSGFRRFIELGHALENQIVFSYDGTAPWRREGTGGIKESQQGTSQTRSSVLMLSRKEGSHPLSSPCGRPISAEPRALRLF
jgi:hypothetical protein